MALSWFVVQTKPAREVAASIEIANQGFEVFFPLFKAFKIKNGQKIEDVSCLFPRYIFVRFDDNPETGDQWGPIRNTRGVSNLLSDGRGKPTPLRDHILNAIRAREMTVELDPVSPAGYELGQKVRICDGPLQGLEGLFTGTPSDRTRVLLEIMGRKIELPAELTVAA